MLPHEFVAGLLSFDHFLVSFLELLRDSKSKFDWIRSQPFANDSLAESTEYEREFGRD